MRRCFDVSRLTRPQRIRCRPALLSPLALGRYRAYALPAPKIDQRSSDYDLIQEQKRSREDIDLEETLEAERQHLEWKRSKEMARGNALGVNGYCESAHESHRLKESPWREYALSRKRPRKPPVTTLPSLLSRQPVRRKAIPESQESVEQEAGPSRLSFPVDSSGKGKAKEVDREPVAAQIPSSSPTKLRRNPVGVQLLSPSLHSQLFPGEPLPQPPEHLLDIARNHLKDNNLSPDGAAILPEISFNMPDRENMPALRGQNIREHFQALGQETAEPYLSLAEEFVGTELPPMPETWEMTKSGWTRYGRDGSIESVPDLGAEKIVCFDVETLYKLSPYPVMATAATPNAWYSWLSPTLFEPPRTEPDEKREFWDTSTPQHHPHDLIPLFSADHERIVIGHNVGYDRQRVKEEYELSRSGTRWIDTLSLHVATRGITSVQRPAWLKYKKNKAEKIEHDSEARAVLMETAESDGDEEMLASLERWSTPGEQLEALQNRWEDVTSVNSLADVALLHCGIPVDKSIRNRFGDDSITHASQLVPELSRLLTYCATDVKTTHEVYKKVFPLYRDSCPHPATFAGVLAMGSSFLPVNESWERYLRNAEEKYREMDEGVRKALRVLAEKLRKEGKKDGDVWAEQLDWTTKSARWADPVPDESGNGTDHTTASTDTDMPSPTVLTREPSSPTSLVQAKDPQPAWYAALKANPSSLLESKSQRYTLPLLLRLSYKSHPVIYLREHFWCFLAPEDRIGDYIEAHGEPVPLGPKETGLEGIIEGQAIFRIGGPKEARKTKLTGPGVAGLVKKGELTSLYPELLQRMVKASPRVEEDLMRCVEDMKSFGEKDVWGSQLDWTLEDSTRSIIQSSAGQAPLDDTSAPVRSKSTSTKAQHGTWPKWYYDLTGPATSDKIPFGELDLTIKKTLAPLLLRLQWQGYPLVHSREHKWVCRVPKAEADSNIEESAVTFKGVSGDERLRADTDHYYCRLPHKDGEGKNVGNPLSKSFVKAIESGELASAAAAEGDHVARQAASDATNMNVLCSYWISSRERIAEQMVVYSDNERTRGMILPRMITMGTVTRRAVESTWLTASNAKKNRVGSELKAMVRAPPGYAIVGADVDSEELWISSVMGDSQFGCHGATAIGWMTLEGTKSAGTDLHSKTASILGISRDAAKVFNYSRIYGAGQKHAVQLLLQGDATLSKEAADKRAKDLYKATKGTKAKRTSSIPPAAQPSIWHGGSESYLFNTLEAIALSDRPTTPALGCGVTKALRKSYLEEGSSYLPSRINWVVQSSGVDYLHLLIVSMEYLLKKYDISARYLISVHDEVRYLAKEEDRYRCALALQIANAWTRALFCYNLGIDDVPQGVAFFSAVDIDHVLRKEVFMTCETPSHPTPIPAGESFDIAQVLDKTGGSLGTPVSPNPTDEVIQDMGQPVRLFPDLNSLSHKQFLEAQANTIGPPAKRWLDSQKPIPGYEGKAMKVVKQAIKAVGGTGRAARKGSSPFSSALRSRNKDKKTDSNEVLPDHYPGDSKIKLDEGSAKGKRKAVPANPTHTKK